MKLLFGCGYLGSRVAALWSPEEHDILIATRSSSRAKVLRSMGYRCLVADVTQRSSLGELPLADTVVFAVGFDRHGDTSIRDVYAGGVRNVLSALPGETRRFIYISTTGVYGPAEGQWVDEQTPPNPQRDGGQASLAAEEVLRNHPLGRNAVILRLAGIYGPGRVPFLAEIHAGNPIRAISSGHLNLIHVDDAATVVLAADKLGASPCGPRVYCVSDGAPPLRGDFYREVARNLSAPAPHFIAPDADSPRAARAAADKRISNARMLGELRVRLSYPSYREGLREILSKDVNAPDSA